MVWLLFSSICKGWVCDTEDVCDMEIPLDLKIVHGCYHVSKGCPKKIPYHQTFAGLIPIHINLDGFRVWYRDIRGYGNIVQYKNSLPYSLQKWYHEYLILFTQTYK